MNRPCLSTPFFAALLAVTLCAGGCSSTGPQRLDTATASVDQTRAQLDAGVKQVERVMAVLQGLETSKDLNGSFREYSRELERLQTIAERVRARRAAMQTRTGAHVDQWNRELTNIQNPTAREVSTQRQADFVAAVQRLTASMDELKADYSPLISNLLDIQLVLANDLSTGGLTAAKPLINDAITQAAEVRASAAKTNQALADAIAEFRR